MFSQPFRRFRLSITQQLLLCCTTAPCAPTAQLPQRFHQKSSKNSQIIRFARPFDEFHRTCENMQATFCMSFTRSITIPHCSPLRTYGATALTFSLNRQNTRYARFLGDFNENNRTAKSPGSSLHSPTRSISLHEDAD